MSLPKILKRYSTAVTLSLLSVAGCATWGPDGGAPRRTATTGLGGPMKAPTSAQEADVEIALGRTAESRGNFEQAAGAYQSAFKRDPSRGDACLRLAVLNDRQGRFAEASPWYERALKINPGDPEVFCDKGYSLYLQRKYAEAEINLRQAIALSPRHARSHNNLGLVYAHMGRKKEALEEFREGGEAAAEAYSNLAYVLTTEGKFAEAREQYQIALNADPTSNPVKGRLRELDAIAKRSEAAPVAAPKGPQMALASRDDKVATASVTLPSPAPVAPKTSIPMPVARAAAKKKPIPMPVPVADRAAATTR